VIKITIRIQKIEIKMKIALASSKKLLHNKVICANEIDIDILSLLPQN